MNDIQKLAAALDRAIDPRKLDEDSMKGLSGPEKQEIAARRKRIADRNAAAEARLASTPSPTHEAYVALAEKLQFVVPENLLLQLESLRQQWIGHNDILLANTHTKVLAAWNAHQADVQSAEPEKLRDMAIRSFEDFEAEFMAKLKAAGRQCGILHGRINSLLRPVLAAFAVEVERLAEQIDSQEYLTASQLALGYEPSHTVLQLRKGCRDLRSTAMPFNLKAEFPSSIADFCSRP